MSRYAGNQTTEAILELIRDEFKSIRTELAEIKDLVTSTNEEGESIPIKNIITTLQEDVNTMGRVIEVVKEKTGITDDDFINTNLAPEGELEKWNYTLNDDTDTVTLNYLNRLTEGEIIVYSKYQINGKWYRTKILNGGKHNEASIGSTTSIYYMFALCTKLEKIIFGKNIDMSEAFDISGMFAGCNALKSIVFPKDFDTSSVQYMSSLFKVCESLESLDLSMFNTSNVTNMSNMFGNCHTIKELDLTSFDTSKVTTWSSMFNNCTSLEIVKVSTDKWVNNNNLGSPFWKSKISSVTYVD